jgi:phosphatidylglycerol---prolipoprotein diacylglyceryl transferase
VIPFFAPEPISIGPLTLSWWLILVVTGIVVGTEWGVLRAKRDGLSIPYMQQMAVFVVGSGFVVSHLFTLVFYETSAGGWTWRNLLDWSNGYSSIGGFIGAALALPIFLNLVHRVPVWAYLDNAAFAFFSGWCFGRVGCSLAHDHIGAPTAWFTGVAFPLDWPRPGAELGLRHDLGMYEAALCIAMVTAMVLLDRKERSHGFFSILCLFVYAPGRFALEFLRGTDLEQVAGRTSDARYAGLTLAQYGCLVLFVLGLWMLWFRWGKGRQDLSGEALRGRRGTG